MSNATRRDVRNFLHEVDAIGEMNAASRLQQAKMLAAADVPDDLVRFMCDMHSRGGIDVNDLNLLREDGYRVPAYYSADMEWEYTRIVPVYPAGTKINEEYVVIERPGDRMVASHRRRPAGPWEPVPEGTGYPARTLMYVVDGDDR